MAPPDYDITKLPYDEVPLDQLVNHAGTNHYSRMHWRPQGVHKDKNMTNEALTNAEYNHVQDAYFKKGETAEPWLSGMIDSDKAMPPEAIETANKLFPNITKENQEEAIWKVLKNLKEKFGY